MWHWILNEDSLMAFHSIIHWITILPWSKKLISEQFFPKDIVPRSIFIIEGVMLINTSTNLKQKFQLTTNVDGFSKKEKKRKKIFFKQKQKHKNNNNKNSNNNDCLTQFYADITWLIQKNIILGNSKKVHTLTFDITWQTLFWTTLGQKCS